jgi:hypothetical protein
MMPNDRSDRDLPARLVDLGGSNAPDYVDDILARTARTRQRPAWTFPERWIPMTVRNTTSAAAPPLRMAWMMLLIALLAAVVAASAVIVGTQIRRLTDPPRVFAGSALLPTACPADTVLKSGDIATVAGNGTLGITGDDGPATSALVWVSGMAVDAAGALYFSNNDFSTIRRVGPDGRISVFASPALGMPYKQPRLMTFDSSGNLFVADEGRIWKRDTAGAITSVAGIGQSSSSGDGGPATDAGINAWGVAVGPHGDLYLDDWNKWRTVDTAGVINTFAGTGVPGFSGDGGPATKAQFGGSDLGGLAADQQGNVFFGDDVNYRIRKVDPKGIIWTFAGTGKAGHDGDGDLATKASISQVNSIATDPAGNVYFVDAIEDVVRKIDTKGIISTIAGSGATLHSSGDCGPATSAKLDSPGVVVVHDGIVYISETGRIRMIVP